MNSLSEPLITAPSSVETASNVEKLGVSLILGDFLDDVDEKKILWEKKIIL